MTATQTEPDIEMLASALDALPSQTAVLANDGEVIYVNSAWRDSALIYGGNERDFGVGWNYLSVCDRAPDTLSTATAAGRGLRELLSGKRDAFEMQYACHAPKERRWFMLRARCFGTGDSVKAVVTHNDITERLLAEESLQRLTAQTAAQAREFDTVLSNSPDFTYIFDLQGRFRYANRPLLALLQLDLNQIIGKTFHELAYPEDLADKLQAQIKQVIDHRHEVKAETPFTSAFGTRDYEYIFAPVFSDQGEVKAVVGSTRDITERKETERELTEAQAAAETASRSKSAFLANMSHEIRTPMSAMLGYTDILAASLHDPRSLHSVDAIRRNGHHLLNLINDILDLSRIEAGKMTVAHERVAPARLVNEVYSMMLVRAASKGLHLKVAADTRLPHTIVSDPRRLQQVLINVIGNAIKFTEAGRVSIDVRLLDETEQLEFRVVDTGVGIDSASQKKLFRPFVQADDSLSRTHEGSGLGLVISRELIQLLGGDIGLTSQPGEGTTVTIVVPTGPLAGVTRHRFIADAAPIDPAPADSELPRFGGRLLVVDDHDDIRELVRQMLEQRGATVSAANSGADALAKVASSGNAPFDLVLLDMQMPGIDGYEVARKLRKLGYTNPIIALTANAMTGDKERCVAAGCNAYLAKPVNRERLLKQVARSLGPASDKMSKPVQKVLLVEDNDDSRAATAQLLTIHGFDVEVAANGRTALEKIRAEKFDTVLLDIGLPDVDGFQVARQVDASGARSGTRLVALTGHIEDRAAFKQAGFDRHLRKPIDIDKLLSILREQE